MQPVFSVIIPTFNRAHKLRACLESVKRQTFTDFEVLVCDDGSTDGTKALVEEITQEGLAITYLYLENSGGPSRPRNLGIHAARADWICLLDSDDIWLPEKLAECYTHIENNDVVYHRGMMVNEVFKKKRNLTAWQVNAPVFKDLMLKTNPIVPSSVCLRKEVILKAGSFSEDTSFLGVEDYDLFIRIGLITNRFKYIPRILFLYRVSDDNISTYDEKNYTKVFRMLGQYADRLSPADKLRLEFTNAYYIAKVSFNNHHYQQAIDFFRKSMFSPNQRLAFRSYIHIILCTALIQLGRFKRMRAVKSSNI